MSHVLTEAEQLELIKKDPFIIKDFNNPSTRVTVEAIEHNPDVIDVIENPSYILKSLASAVRNRKYF